MHVEHFEPTIEKLIPIWQNSESKISDSLNFIYSHQIKMWTQLSSAIFEIT